MKHSVICLAAALAAATVAGAALAEPARIVGTVTDVFGPRFVVETATGKVLVDIGRKGADKVAVKQGEKIEIEGDRRKDELRARRVTLANGHAYVVDKRGVSWREWLVGKRAPEAAGYFGPAEARKIASERGYQVSSEPVATKKHYAVTAAKDGRNYDLQVHRDGRVEPRPAFGAAEAGKLAVDNGYQLTGAPLPVRKHFRATAAKGGKSYEIDLHRDGKIVEHTPFGRAEASKLVTDKGYELVGELQPVDEHFELLGRMDGKFYELHAHRGGKLVRARVVDATDPKWGPLVR